MICYELSGWSNQRCWKARGQRRKNWTSYLFEHQTAEKSSGGTGKVFKLKTFCTWIRSQSNQKFSFPFCSSLGKSLRYKDHYGLGGRDCFARSTENYTSQSMQNKNSIAHVVTPSCLLKSNSKIFAELFLFFSVFLFLKFKVFLKKIFGLHY